MIHFAKGLHERTLATLDSTRKHARTTRHLDVTRPGRYAICFGATKIATIDLAQL